MIDPDILSWLQAIFYVLASVALLIWIVRQLR